MIKTPINIETLYITNLDLNNLDSKDSKDLNVKYNELYGGSFTNKVIILDLLNNKFNRYAYIRYPNSNKLLCMQLPNDDIPDDKKIPDNKKKFNKEQTKTSVFVANGFFSTVIAYKTISDIILERDNKITQHKLENEMLAVKITIVKQKGKDIFDEWRTDFKNIHYLDFKRHCGNFIADLYFKGSNIEVNKQNLNDLSLLKDNNRQIVFDIWRFYNGDIEELRHKLIYLAKSIGVCIYAFNIIEKILLDIKTDNVKPDNKQNLVFVDIEYKVLQSMKIKSGVYNDFIFYNNFMFYSIIYIYIKKQLFHKLELYKQDTEDWIYTELSTHKEIIARPQIVLQKDITDESLYTGITNQIFSKWVKNKLSSDKQINKLPGDPYYINFKPLYDKYNVLFLYQLFIQLFYNDFNIIKLLHADNTITINEKKRDYITETVSETFNTDRIINKTNILWYTQILTIHNLNNIAILQQYMNALRKISSDLPHHISERILLLIFWPEYGVGLIAPDFPDVLPYSILFFECKRIFGIDNLKTPEMKRTEDTTKIEEIYIVLQQLIHENIGTNPLPDSSEPVYSGTPLEIMKQRKDYEYLRSIPTSGGTTPEDYKRILNERFIAEFYKYTSPEVIAEVKRIGGISEITLDNMTYELWAKSRSLQKNRNEPQYKTEEDLLYPSPYSTFPSNKLRIAPFLYIPHLVKDDATNEFIVNPDIELIIAEPSRVVDIFRRNKDTYQLFNPYERDIPYAEHINDSLLYRLKRQLTQSEIDQIKIILYPERSLITTTDLDIEAFKIELNRFKQSEKSKLYKTQTKKNQYERPPSEQSILDIEKNISTFRQIFNRLQFTDDKLKDIIAKIQRIDFTQTKPYTDDEINELIEPDKGFEPSNNELTSILLILRTILHFIDIRYDTIPLIIERLQMELTKIKNLTEILDIVLTQIEFTTSKHNELIHRLKFKSVKTDFTEEEIIGIIDKIKSKRAEEQKKSVNREQTIINANKSFGDILDKPRKFDKDMEQKILEEDIEQKKQEEDKPATIFKSVKPFGSWGKKTKSPKLPLNKNPDKDTTYYDRRRSKEKTKERDDARRKKGIYQKYLKYRNKFLKLKNELNI